jgi:small-conductance mechanosensitive channel
VQLVESILLECAREHQEITDYPTPFARFYDFGNSSLDFQLFFWTNNAFRVENIKSDLRFAIDRKFRENKVTIPFPQRDVHIKNP